MPPRIYDQIYTHFFDSIQSSFLRILIILIMNIIIIINKILEFTPKSFSFISTSGRNNNYNNVA